MYRHPVKELATNIRGANKIGGWATLHHDHKCILWVFVWEESINPRVHKSICGTNLRGTSLGCNRDRRNIESRSCPSGSRAGSHAFMHNLKIFCWNRQDNLVRC